jgi:hypothetical protein
MKKLGQKIPQKQKTNMKGFSYSEKSSAVLNLVGNCEYSYSNKVLFILTPHLKKLPKASHPRWR